MELPQLPGRIFCDVKLCCLGSLRQYRALRVCQRCGQTPATKNQQHRQTKYQVPRMAPTRFSPARCLDQQLQCGFAPPSVKRDWKSEKQYIANNGVSPNFTTKSSCSWLSQEKALLPIKTNDGYHHLFGLASVGRVPDLVSELPFDGR